MANYTNLKNAIAQVIKTNGNEEITGNVMQTTLRTIVDSVGAYRTFGGIVQPSTSVSTIDQNTFFMAYSPGEYTNFGGIVFNGVGILLLYNTPTGWQSDVVQLEVEDGSVTADKLAEGSVGRFALQDEAVNMDKLAYFTVTLSDAYPLEEPNIPLTQEDVLEMLGFGIDGLRQAILDDKLARVVSDESEMLTPVSYTGEVEDGDFDAYVTASVDGRLYQIELEVEGNLIFGALKRYLDPLMFSVSYARLVALRDERKLIAGAQYRIHDYETWADDVTYENYGSNMIPFDVIVTATSYNTFSEDARCMRSLNDNGYFANCDLAAWEIKYTIDNDKSKYEWADETNGKGVIYWMRDEWGNEAGYDFKNIMFSHYKISSINDIHISSTLPANSVRRDFIQKFKSLLGSSINVNNYHAWYTPCMHATKRYLTADDLTGYVYEDGWVPQEGEKYICLVCGEAQNTNTYSIVAKVDYTPVPFFTFDFRSSAIISRGDDLTLDGTAKANKISPYYSGSQRMLGNSSFICVTTKRQIRNATIANFNNAVVGCQTNIVNFSVYSLTWSAVAGIYLNAESLQYCVTGAGFSRCKFVNMTSVYAQQLQYSHGERMSNSSIGSLNRCSFGDIGNNKIGANCTDVILENGANYNTIGNSCSAVKIEQKATNNVIGNNCTNVDIEAGSTYTTIGQNTSAKIGYGCDHIDIAPFMQVEVGFNCKYIDIDCTLTTSTTNICRGIIVRPNIIATSDNPKRASIEDVNQDYTTSVRGITEDTIQI